LRGVGTFFGAVGLPLQLFLFLDGLFHLVLLKFRGGCRRFWSGGDWSGCARNGASGGGRLRAELRLDPSR
jgi:hypothetical protein